MSEPNIPIPTDKIEEFGQRYPIRSLSLFGSVLRDDFTPESDVDILVEYEANAKISFFDMAQQEIDLTDILGRKVDLRTPQELSRYFRQHVLDMVMVIYKR